MFSIITIFYLLLPPTTGEYCTTYDKDFSYFRYAEQIPYCKRNVSTRRKDAICRKEGVYNRKNFKVDHIIPLSLGGNNSDRNLWCQHKSIDTAKYEGIAYRNVNGNKWTIQEAIDYVNSYKFKLRDK